MADSLKPRSGVITDGRDRAPSRAMFKAVGFTDSDLSKPLIGVANTWIETMPLQLSPAPTLREGERRHPRRGRHSDGIQHHRYQRRRDYGHRRHAGLPGQPRSDRGLHRTGLHGAGMFDAVVCVVGCDKTIPAGAMALARLNIPGLVLYGGTIAPGNLRGKDVTIQDVFEAVGANAGKMIDAELFMNWKVSPAPPLALAAGNTPPTRCRRQWR